MRLKNLILVLAIFVFGLVLGTTLHASDAFTSPVYSDGYELPATLYSGLTGRAIERPSPSDHLTADDIAVYKDRVVLDLQDVIFAKFTNTNSMDSVLDESANAIEQRPKSEDEVQEGDIIAYQNACSGDSTIIHRVIKKAEDQLGTYYIVKGDNNPQADPCVVRFEDVKGVVVAIIY